MTGSIRSKQFLTTLLTVSFSIKTDKLVICAYDFRRKATELLFLPNILLFLFQVRLLRTRLSADIGRISASDRLGITLPEVGN